MASTNITQLRRVVFRKWNASDSEFTTFTFEPDDLGQDTVASINIAPRKMSRASSRGTTETPMAGTFDAFAGSVSFLLDTWKNLGLALQNWTKSTYEGANATAGQISDDASNLCAGGEYLSVVLQGVCDDGSETEIEFTRCIPSVDDDIEIGTSETPSVTLNLNPIIYNAGLHASDGYPQKSYRLGDYSTTEKMRLNASTGAYTAVNSGN